MSKIDENEAPEGFRAVECEGGRNGCKGCFYYKNERINCWVDDDIFCHPHNRKDGQDVIFKKKEVEK